MILIGPHLDSVSAAVKDSVPLLFFVICFATRPKRNALRLYRFLTVAARRSSSNLIASFISSRL